MGCFHKVLPNVKSAYVTFQNFTPDLQKFYTDISAVSATLSNSVFRSRALRRDREFLSFDLVLRDEIENFYLSVSCFETRARFSVFILVIRDKNENSVKKSTFLEGWPSE